MTDDKRYQISRRNVLAGLGTIGIASAGAGLGTSAFFSDEESFENNVLTAGELDLLVHYYSHVDQGSHGVFDVSGTANGGAVTSVLDDVKPGDSGHLGFCFDVVDNPAYLWWWGALTANDDNGSNEAEVNHSDDETFGAGEGDLADAIEVVVSYCDSAVDGDDAPSFTPTAEIWSGSFADFLALAKYGLPLDGDASAGVAAPGEQACFAGTRTAEVDNPCVCIEWSVPTEVGNEIQTDSLSFDLQFYAEQCRHNDGTVNPYFSVETATGAGEWSDVSWNKHMGMEVLFGSSVTDPDTTIGKTPHEINIHPAIGEAGSQAQHAFTSGTAYPFEATFDPTGTPSASISIDGVTVTDSDLTSNLQYNGVEQGPRVPTDGAVALTVRAADFAGDVTTLADLAVNGNPLGLPALTASKTGSLSDELKYVDVSGLNFAAPVTVSGTVTFEVDTSITDYRSTPGLGIDWK